MAGHEAGEGGILVVLGTRPEAIKLAPVILALRQSRPRSVRVLSTGQHAAMLQHVLAFHAIEPDIALCSLRAGQSLDRLLARLLREIGQVLDLERPTQIVVQGDTATAYAATLAAYHRRIPVAHVEAGLRTGDLERPWPEEGYRRGIAPLARVHFAPTRGSADALLREGIPADRIFMTGNTIVDALQQTQRRLLAEPALAAGLDPLLMRFAGRPIVAVTAHRRENLDRIELVAGALAALAADREAALVVPLHPNPQVRRPLARVLRDLPDVALTPPLDYPHFIRLLHVARLVLTDSGGVQEEAATLGRPVLVLRDRTERSEGVENGHATLVGTCPNRILTESRRALRMPPGSAQDSSPYGDGRAAERIAEILLAA